MERVRRRWWTWTVSVFAMLVILAATVSGLFQAAVLALPSYRDDLSDWVTKVAGRPVDIGGVSLVWHGIFPRLDLSDITLYSDDGEDEVLSAQRLSLGFSFLRLATGDFTPTQIELSGLSLAVNVADDGKVSIVGLDNINQNSPADYDKLLREVARFRRVRLSNCQIELTASQLPDQTLNLTLASAQVSQTLTGLEAEAEISLPAAYGKSIDLDAAVEGDVARPETWNGVFNVSSRQLQPQPWLRPYLLPGTRVAVDGGRLDLHGNLQAGHVTTVEARAESDTLLIGRAGQNVTAKSLDFLALASAGAEGWQFDIKRLQFDDEDQLRGSLHYAALPQGAGYELKADADVLRLTRLAPWLAYLREPPQALTWVARVGGEVDRLVLRLHHDADDLRYSLLATLKDASLKPGGGPVGFSGLTGDLSADENSGRFRITGSGLKLELPHALRNPVPFEQLTGEARWSRRADGWQLEVPAFAWKVQSIAGSGQINLLLPAEEGRSPELNLSANFSAGDANQGKPFIPLIWHDNLRDWLDRAIVGGRVPHGQLEIHGPLADFPFGQRKTGAWKLDLDVINGNLAYLPDWPSVEQIKAHLTFAGAGLDIQAENGSVLGNHVDKASARFADLSTGLLQVDASVSGETARFYDFLRNSPLKKTLAGLVDNTSASGPAQVAVHLDIPLRDAVHTTVAGNVALDGVQLRYKALQQPISEIQGSIAFNNTGAQANKLSAKFEDVDITARVLPRANTHGVVAADFSYALNPDGSGISAFVPAMLRKFISGSAHWSAELPLGAEDTTLSLSTDLQGVAVVLPQPLGKSPDETVPLSVVIGSGAADGATHVHANYRDRLDTDIALVNSGDSSGQRVRGVNLQLGHGIAPAAGGDGINIGGDVDAVDLGAWSGVLGEARGSGLALHQAELHAGRVVYMGQSVRDVHAVFVPDPSGWATRLDGTGAEGDLVWRDAAGGSLNAALKHLAVDFLNVGVPQDGAAGKSGNIFDPNQFPLIDIACDQLGVNGFDLGKLALATQRVPGGQRVERMTLSGGKTTLNADGWWKREKSLSSAALKFDLQSQDSAATLKAFGYSPSLDAKQSKFSGDLNWVSEPAGIAWAQARGRINIDVKNGSLRAIDPGAGRVLGLLNFYALPRRLMLDFHDVVNSGLGFDTVTGDYDLADGAAVTNNLDIKGPSLTMEVRGKIGLATRDFDQKVTVHPDVSTGAVIGATLVGGPAAGALVLLAQQVLGKPLDRLTQFSYHLSGPWDNPKVE
jgi:uncharacterized protein (TIGR02099 family)